MSSLIGWLEAHDKLAGWAQFFGAFIALAVTYVTAFAPHWRRKRQLASASDRLVSHGYEALESARRTFGLFFPSSININAATIALRSIINELNKFPIYELDDQGANSKARRLVAISVTLEGTCLFLDKVAFDLGNEQMSVDDRDFVREWLADRLKTIQAMMAGKPLSRPEASDFVSDLPSGRR